MEEDKKQEQKPKRSKFKLRLACFTLVFGLIAFCLLTLAFLWFGGHLQKSLCGTVVNGSPIWNRLECENTRGGNFFDVNNGDNTTSVVTPEEEVITGVVERSSAAVVAIGIKGDTFNQDEVIGTGFIISNDGLIITNRHVVSEDVKYFVYLKDDETAIPVTKIYRDPVNDIALIQVDRTNLVALPLGDSDNLKIGQTVIAIGNPLGKYSGTVTSGIISGLNREVSVGDSFFSSKGETYEDVIQTDAAINPGNSGGPLLNADGEVIGINFATVSGADNLSFALPINRAKSRIEELDKFGKFRIPYIGVEYRMRIVFVDGSSTVGAQILSVAGEGPAARAGLQKNDVIIEFNGSDLTEDSLFSLIQKTEIGQEVKVTILRGGTPQQVSIKIGEKGEGF